MSTIASLGSGSNCVDSSNMLMDDYDASYRHFRDTLNADLTQNIKPVIMSLTMLAEDYQKCAHLITRAIDEYIRQVSPDLKILGLYLMDSIMKNLKETKIYIQLFERNIVDLFVYVFESVDEVNRRALFKLRQTWNEIFNPATTLYYLDVSIKKIDPAWPITANMDTGALNRMPSTQTQSSNTGTSQQVKTLVKQPHSVTQDAVSTSATSNNANKLVNTNLNATTTTKTTIVSLEDLLNVRQPSHQEKLVNNQQNKPPADKHQSKQHSNDILSMLDSKNVVSASVSAKSDSIVKSQANQNVNRDPRLLNRAMKPSQQKQQLPVNSNSSQPSNGNGVKEVKNSAAPINSRTSASVSPNKKSTESTSSSTSKASLTSSASSSNIQIKSNNSTSGGIKRSSPSSQPNQQNTTGSSMAETIIKKAKISPPTPNKSINITKPTSEQTSPPSKPQSKPLQNNSNSNITNSQGNITKSSTKNVTSPQQHDSSSKQIQKSVSSTEISSKTTTKQSQQQQTIKSSSSSSSTSTNKQQNLDESNNDSENSIRKASSQSQPKSTNTTTSASTATTQNAAVKKKIPSLFEVLAPPIITNKMPTAKSADSKSNLPPAKKSTNSSSSTSSQPKTIKLIPPSNTAPSSTSKPTTAKSSNAKKENLDILTSANINNQPINTQTDSSTIQTLFNDVDERQISMKLESSRLSQPVSDITKVSKQPETTPMDTSSSLTSTESQGTSLHDKITFTSNSLNDLQQQLVQSQQVDMSNNSNSSAKTQELIDMIKILISQQKELLEQKQNSNIGNQDLSQDAQQQQQQQQEEHEQLDDDNQQQMDSQNNYNEIVSYNDLPPIKPRDKNDNQNDSLLIIDGRSYRIQPDVRRCIKIYYHDHELFCDTRTKDVYVDTKRVYKMGDTTKEVMLNGRRVRLMYMGRRIELWIDGISFHFRADSPPKQISLQSNSSSQCKRYYVTIDSRTMDMYFNNFKVCQINGGPHGTGSNIIMCRLAPDDFEQHEISFVCPPKRIMIDGQPRKMRYDLAVPCIEMDQGQFYVIRFTGAPKEIFIDDTPYMVHFDKTSRIKLNGRAHELAWGGPGFEVIIDGRPYEIQFNKPPREIVIGTRPHLVYIAGDAPDVKIFGRLPPELLEDDSNDNVRGNEENKMVDKKDNDRYGKQQHQQLPPLMPLMSQQTNPPKLMANPINPPSTTNTATAPNVPQLPVQELLQKLIKTGILPSSQPKQEPKNATESQKNPVVEEKIPDLTSLDPDILKQKYSGAIQKLYSGVQCATCGNRFNQLNTDNNTSSSRYSKHLDWHFRQNKKEKEEINKAHSRAWYYSFSDWLLYEELSEDANLLNTDGLMEVDQVKSSGSNKRKSSNKKNSKKYGKNKKKDLLSVLSDEYDDDFENNDGDDNEEGDQDDDLIEENDEDNDELNKIHQDDLQTNFNNDENDHQTQAKKLTNKNHLLSENSANSSNNNGNKTCPATNDVGDSCFICNDPFEIFWYEEKEEWHFKDAIRVNNNLYHPICLEDAANNNNNTSISLNNSIQNGDSTISDNVVKHEPMDEQH